MAKKLPTNPYPTRAEMIEEIVSTIYYWDSETLRGYAKEHLKMALDLAPTSFIKKEWEQVD